MSEMTKTFIFFGVAIAVVLVAYLSKPQLAFHESQIAGANSVLAEVEDPLAAERLEITTFNEETSRIRRMEVAKIDGEWVIPSHQNYPADGDPNRRLGPAAASVINLKVLDVVSTSAGDHSTYGVVEPDLQTLSAGALGVGTRVVMKDAQGKNMVNLVIGKEVKDAPNLRYVRVVNQDPIYVVELDTTPLTTRFADWIEADLLKLNAYDIQQVDLNDYSAQFGFNQRGEPAVSITPRSEIKVAYSDTEDLWTLKSLKVFNRSTSKYEDVRLASGDQPNEPRLNEMKQALDDLKIVAVEHKPEGLSQNLKADQGFLNNRQAVESLYSRGFFPFGDPADPSSYEILSSEGEIICQMIDGVEYVLRFGDIAGAEDEEDAAAQAASGGLNRYLFVMARFNQDAIAKPELVEVPDTQTGAWSGETLRHHAARPYGGLFPGVAPALLGLRRSPLFLATFLQDDLPTEEQALDGADPQPVPGEAAPAGQQTPGIGDQGTTDLFNQLRGDAPLPDDLQEPGDQTEQEDIELENQRKLDEYNAKIEAGKQRVQELNERFGDWYYIISDDVYQKIHLSRNDVIQSDQNVDSPLDIIDSLRNDRDLLGIPEVTEETEVIEEPM